MDMILTLCCLIPFGLIFFGVRAGILVAQAETPQMQAPHPNIWEEKEEDDDSFFHAGMYMNQNE